jgi:8-oxo-dGTP diphosphatase
MEAGCMTPRPQGVSMIFRNISGEVLLFLRDDTERIPFPGCWDLLGGHVEPGETAEQAIARELDEEIEYKLEGAPRLFRMSSMPDRDEYTFWQAADFDLGRTVLHEGQRLKWFSETEIRAMGEAEIAFGFKSVLLAFFEEQRRGHRPA